MVQSAGGRDTLDLGGSSEGNAGVHADQQSLLDTDAGRRHFRHPPREHVVEHSFGGSAARNGAQGRAMVQLLARLLRGY